MPSVLHAARSGIVSVQSYQGRVGPGFTLQLTDTVQQMLCDFIMFIHMFFPVFPLKQLDLGSGRLLNTCSSGQGAGGPGVLQRGGGWFVLACTFLEDSQEQRCE